MTTTTNDPRLRLGPGITLNKVPEVIAIFWIIKVLATTVGETAADYLNETLGFGLTNTTLVTAALFAVVIAVQLSLKRYVAPVYWSAVVLIGPETRNVRPGDHVLFIPQSGLEMDVGGDTYLLLRERDVQAITSEQADRHSGQYL